MVHGLMGESGSETLLAHQDCYNSEVNCSHNRKSPPTYVHAHIHLQAITLETAASQWGSRGSGGVIYLI